MNTPARPTNLLLDCFAQFYEEVACLKQASANGLLPRHLGLHQAPTPSELAHGVSERLESLLQAQTQEMQRHYSDAQQRAHQAASYVMTVLADEIFIFDLPWSAQHAWLDVLLEHRRFSSRVAGRHFFEMAEQVLQSAQRNALHRDLAACFLLALTLGFQGMHRGPQGHVALQVLRRRLQRFVQGDVPASVPERLFESAYAHCVRSDVEVRVAPVQPWISYTRKVLLALLLLSSVLWLWLINPLLRGG